MNKKSMMGVMLTSALLLGAAASLMASVPPPPVNQTIGFPDTKFGALVEADCRACHGASTVDRHHNLIYTTVPTVSCIRQASQPATLATGCHVQVPDGTGGFVFQNFRNCLNCHTTSPHHTTPAALIKDCVSCHGNVIDNPNDGHTIPTYPISSVTPLRNGKLYIVPGTNPPETHIVQGCEACHQAAAATTTTPFAIMSNEDTHHGTGIGLGDNAKCNWCHDVSTPTSTITIRQCEACHGVKSLHNIQVNTPATANPTTIVPGAELAGYGHIGANWDCMGCHGNNFYKAAGAESPAATTPVIKSQSQLVIASGLPTTLTLNGVAFTNLGADMVTPFNPEVEITNGTTTQRIVPFSITESEVKISVPALAQGNYDVRVFKGTTQSNKAVLSVVPKVQIASAVLGSRSSLTITGKNFGSAPPAGVTSGLGVFVAGQPCKVVSWSATKIVASSTRFTAGAQATVKSINGTVTGTISGVVKKTR